MLSEAVPLPAFTRSPQHPEDQLQTLLRASKAGNDLRPPPLLCEAPLNQVGRPLILAMDRRQLQMGQTRIQMLDQALYCCWITRSDQLSRCCDALLAPHIIQGIPHRRQVGFDDCSNPAPCPARWPCYTPSGESTRLPARSPPPSPSRRDGCSFRLRMSSATADANDPGRRDRGFAFSLI